MNSLSQLSRRYLRRQWKRTTFTSMGIIMATALFAGLALLLTSFINMYIQAEAASNGSWHYHVSGMTIQQAEQLQANIRVQESDIIVSSKYLAKLAIEDNLDTDISQSPASQADYQMLLRDVSQIGDGLTPYPMSLISGRMPENSSEIVLNTSTINYFPDVEIGSQIKLELLEKGNSNSEQLLRTYTITGIADWRDTQLPNPVFYALTQLEEDEKDLAEVYLIVKAASDFEGNAVSALNDVLPDLGLDEGGALGNARISSIKYVQFDGDSIYNDLSTIRMQTHDELLRFLGQSSYDTTNNEITMFFGILALIIMASVVFVIRNSFAMSVSERTSEYGLLRVVGGSPSQIRRLVLQDALQMAVISIPIGLLAGVVAMKITLGYVSKLDLPEVEYLKLIVSPWPLILAAGLSTLAIILAALSPAIRAGRLSPMQAIRKTGVYTLESKSSRSLTRRGKLSRKLTGVTGFLAGRSIRRDRRRFRITTLSVMISAVLFLAAGGISFMFSKQLSQFNTEQVDFRLQTTEKVSGEVNQEFSSFKDTLDKQDRIERFAEYAQFYQTLDSDRSIFSPELIESYRNAFQIQGRKRSEEEALDMLLNNFSSVKFIMAERPLLDQLPLSNRDKVWKELQAGKVIIAQTIPISLGDLSFQTVPMTKLGVGDTIKVQNQAFADIESGETPEIPEAFHSYEIAAEITELPWFNEGFFTGFGSIIVIADADIVKAYLNKSAEAGQEVLLEHIIALDAIDGQEDQVEKMLQPVIEKNDSNLGGSSIYLQNNYAAYRNGRNMVKFMNIFVYGFATVIVLICSMNILNTVSTNVLLRRRELAMLQAVGMSKSQVRKMLLMESSLYGLSGAIWGSAIGTVLLYLLGKSVDNTVGGLTIQAIPWGLVLATLAGALIISVAAGILPIRRVIKDDIVEAIRAQE